MKKQLLHLSVLPDTFAIVHLETDADVPAWCDHKSSVLMSMTRTSEELSIVCLDGFVPEDQKAERGRRVLRVEGQLDLSLSGVLSEPTTVLAEAHIPVFVLSTFRTDYLFVEGEKLGKAVEMLSKVCEVSEIV